MGLAPMPCLSLAKKEAITHFFRSCSRFDSNENEGAAQEL
jgi:hypothetical protein